MSARKRFRGDTISYVNPTESKISYGDVVDLGTRIGIAACDIEAGETGTLAVTEVYELPASNAEAFVVGQEVFWDGTQLVGTAGDLTRAGWVTEPKLLAGTVASIKID
ncbi:MAG: DUF2190 family protein [Armatimonadota bacterium]|nr:DUF2190 family protein [bacterium]